MTTTTVQEDKNGYFSTRLPKQLADSMDLEGGDKLEWKIMTGDTLSVTKK